MLAFADQELSEWLAEQAALLISDFTQRRQSIARSLREGEGFCRLNLRHLHKEGGTHTLIWVRVWQSNGQHRSQPIGKPKTTRDYNPNSLIKVVSEPFQQLVLDTEAMAGRLREENRALVKIRDALRTIRSVVANTGAGGMPANDRAQSSPA